MVFRRYESRWLALCLENGTVSQGATRREAQEKLSEAIESLGLALAEDPTFYHAAIPVAELHEFLTLDVQNAPSEHYEFQAVYCSRG